MGFFSSLRSTFAKAAPFIGAGVGFMAGGGLAGASVGYNLGGQVGSALGPSSSGGITGVVPGSGRASGTEARDYYDEAFPGTNPWERLGAGNPMGQMAAAGLSAETARRNVDKQVGTQQSIAALHAAASQQYQRH